MEEFMEEFKVGDIVFYNERRCKIIKKFKNGWYDLKTILPNELGYFRKYYSIRYTQLKQE